MIPSLRVPRCLALLLLVATLGAAPSRADAGWIVLYSKNGYETSPDAPADVKSALDKVKRSGKEIHCVAFTPKGGWAILYGKSDFESSNIPENAKKQLEDFAKDGKKIRCIGFGDNDSWVIIYDVAGYAAHNVGKELSDQLAKYNNAAESIDQVTLLPGNVWTTIYKGNSYWTWNCPDSMLETLRRAADGKDLKLRALIVAPKEGWLILHSKDEIMSRGLPLDLAAVLQKTAKKGLRSVVFFEPPAADASSEKPPKK